MILHSDDPRVSQEDQSTDTPIDAIDKEPSLYSTVTL